MDPTQAGLGAGDVGPVSLVGAVGGCGHSNEPGRAHGQNVLDLKPSGSSFSGGSPPAPAWGGAQDGPIQSLHWGRETRLCLEPTRCHLLSSTEGARETQDQTRLLGMKFTIRGE